MKQCYPKKLLLFLMLYIISAKAVAQTRLLRFIVAFLLILCCFTQTKLNAQSYGNVALGGRWFCNRDRKS